MITIRRGWGIKKQICVLLVLGCGAAQAAPVIYATDGNNILTIDIVTGEETILTSISNFNELAYGAGVLYASQGNGGNIYTVDLVTGELTEFATPGYAEMEFGGSILYGNTTGDIWTIDPTTGQESRFSDLNLVDIEYAPIPAAVDIEREQAQGMTTLSF